MKREIIEGIYCIEAISGSFSKIGWKYIGQGTNCLNRFVRHFGLLKHKKHENEKLQNYYNKYGISAFKSYILMKCPKSEQNFWEKYFIKTFDSYKNGFNKTEGGDDTAKTGKHCVMYNFRTGEIVKCDSHIEFARKYNVDRKTLDLVINKKGRTRVKDWICYTNQYRPKIYNTISPFGEKYKIINIKGELYRFCREHKIKNKDNFWLLLNGDRPTCEGWRLKSSCLLS